MENSEKNAIALKDEDLARIIISISNPAPESVLVKTAMDLFGLEQNDATTAVHMLEKSGIIAKSRYAVGDMIEAPSAFLDMYRITDKGIDVLRRYL